MGRALRTVALAAVLAATPGCALSDGPSEPEIRAQAVEDAQDACSPASQEIGQSGRFSAGFIDFTCRRFAETVRFEYAADQDITGDREPFTGPDCDIVLSSRREAEQFEQTTLCDAGSIVVPVDGSVSVDAVIDVAAEATSLSS